MLAVLAASTTRNFCHLILYNNTIIIQAGGHTIVYPKNGVF